MKEDELYIANILESILIIEEYLKNTSLKDFEKSNIKIDAVSKRFEEIGENAKKISSVLKKKHTEVNWRNMEEMRNFFVHAYSYVKAERLYKEATKEILILKHQIQIIKNELEQ